MIHRKPVQCAAAVILTGAMLFAMSGAALAQQTPDVSCDEAYYATLDYYGALQKGGVVKSYQTNGCSAVRDYGSYDSIVNLTDDSEPTVSDDSVTFDFGSDAPSQFYFEGITAKPYSEMPWTISLTYKLNGVVTEADKLAEKSGTVEIDLDIVPNTSASEYARNNMVLTASAAFDAENILSLSAPGAEVQLLGNLKSVTFMAMPGEEQHDTITVGSDDFEFSGILMLIMPATLSQLDKINDLRTDKEKVEDSYHAVNDSVDVILDTLDGMDDSLSETADGLDKLNGARASIHAQTGSVYSSIDASLIGLNTVASQLSPIAGHLTTASKGVSDINDSLTALTGNLVALSPALEQTRDDMDSLETDLGHLRELSDDLEDHNSEAASDISALQDDMDDFTRDAASLQTSLTKLQGVVAQLQSVEGVSQITINGMTTDEIRQAAEAAEGAYAKYQAALKNAGLTEAQLSFEDFLVQYGKKTQAEAETIAELYKQAQASGFGSKLDQIDSANALIGLFSDQLTAANKLVSAAGGTGAAVLGDLSTTCGGLGSLSDNLNDLLALGQDVLGELDDHSGEVGTTLDDLSKLGDAASDIAANLKDGITKVNELDGVINDYEPDARQALTDMASVTSSVSQTLGTASASLEKLENLFRDNEDALNEGTEQSLDGLSDTLRKSAEGLEQTDVLRTAHDTITSLIDNEWDDHTGDVDNILKIDSTASPVSMTSRENETPASIQYILRTQEIKKDDSSGTTAAAAEAQSSGGFWSRVGNMFADIWKSITSLFSGSRKAS